MTDLGEVVDVGVGHASHRDAAVAGHVDGVLVAERVDLLLGEAGEREHADLVVDMRPVFRGASLRQLVDQQRAHVD